MFNAIDFSKEWNGFVDSELNSLGYNIPRISSLEKTILLFQILERRIKGHHRKVHISEELEYKNDVRINHIIEKLRNGEDIIPHLSKTLNRISFKDLLLNDWGIHHFHLGCEMEESGTGFVTRTGDVLFAMIEENDAYLIDIMPHNNWAEINLLNIVDKNWSNLLDNREVKNIESDFTIESNEDVLELRAAKINYCLRLKSNRVVRGKNSGLTVSGDNVYSVMKAQKMCCRQIAKVQHCYDNESDKIKNAIIEYNSSLSGRTFEFEPHFTYTTIGIKDKDTGVTIILGRI